MHVRRTIAATVAAVALLSGCGAEGGGGPVAVQTNDDGWNGTYLAEPWQPSDLALQRTDGTPLALDQADDRLRLVFFGYTKCPDVCQVVMGTIASAVNRLDADQRRQVEVVFVTTDPARDEPRVLREYLDRFDPNFVGLTGPLQTVIDVAEPLKVHVEQGERLPSGGYEVDHTAAVVGIRDGDARMVWTQGVTPPDLAEDIEKLLEEKA